jgi:outer membrane cobalamin receptor
LLAGVLWAQNYGTIVGTVTDPSGAVVPGATILIQNTVTGYKATTTSDQNGQYKFTQVPYVPYTIHVEAPGFQHSDVQGEVKNNIPVTANVQLVVAQTSTTVDVSAEAAPILETESSGTHHDIEYAQIQRQVVPQVGRGVEAIVETAPGMAQDDNGRFHPRGSESQVQYVVDGVPITENLSATFSSTLDSKNLSSAEVITGNVPAEYGDKLGAVVNVSTRSGLTMPWTGSISSSYGTFNAEQLGVEFGGHLKNFGTYTSASTERSNRYLDPPEIANFHNHGGNTRLFQKFDWNPTQHDTFRLNFTINGTDFQVPNRLQQQLLGQAQREELRDDSESIGWNHVFGTSVISDVVVYRRAASTRLLDPDITAFPVFVQQHRNQTDTGFKGSVAKQTSHHNIKTGIQYVRTPLHENFFLAATDPAILADATSPLSQFSVANPFFFNDRLTGNSFSYFLQDRMTYDRLTFDVGMRYDHYGFVTKQDYVSPRIGVAYFHRPTKTVFRASFDRLFQYPPVENLLLSSSPEAAVLSPLAQNPRAVPPEKQSAYEFGVQQELFKHIRLDASHYIKQIENFSDKDQLLDTSIVFPVAIARGDVRGTELRLDLTPIHNIQGYISYANARATATTPIAGGLFLGQVNDELLIPGIQFPADHDVRNTGSFGATYTIHRDSWFTLDGRYDSGVPTDASQSELLGVDPALLKGVNLARGRVEPRAIFDIAMGTTLRNESEVPIGLQFAVSNLFDRFYLYNFESVFSGTHVGRPREFSGRLTFTFKGKPKTS